MGLTSIALARQMYCNMQSSGGEIAVNLALHEVLSKTEFIAKRLRLKFTPTRLHNLCRFQVFTVLSNSDIDLESFAQTFRAALFSVRAEPSLGSVSLLIAVSGAPPWHVINRLALPDDVASISPSFRNNPRRDGVTCQQASREQKRWLQSYMVYFGCNGEWCLRRRLASSPLR